MHTVYIKKLKRFVGSDEAGLMIFLCIKDYWEVFCPAAKVKHVGPVVDIRRH